MIALLLVWVGSASAGGLVEVGDVTFDPSTASAVADARAALEGRRFEEAAAAYGALADAGGGLPARVAQAIALYEAGELRGARAAAEQVLRSDPRNVLAQNVLGVALVDSGAVELGIAQLETARKTASGPLAARVLVNLGLAHYDRGDAERAAAFVAEAKPLAEGDPGLLAAVAGASATIAGLSGRDAGLGQLLGSGNVRAARASAQRTVDAARTRRDRVNAAIELAAVERSEGSLDASAKRLGEAVKQAREAGMLREVAVGLGNMGLASSLAGRLPLAVDMLRAGANEAQKGGYRVIEADLRCELGITLMHMGDVAGAEVEQRAAGALLADMQYAQGVARQAELGGQIATARGDLATADQALSQAIAFYDGLGRSMDAARVATSLAAAWQSKDDARAAKWAAKAEGYFAKANDALGPAHVAMARALAKARKRDLEGALQGFARTVELAEKVGGERGTTVARVARENAAATLVALGHDADIARLAASRGISDLLERQRKLDASFSAYEAGLVAYDARTWEVARARFQEARQGFDALGEEGYALRARRAAAWSVYNAAVAQPVAVAYPTWNQLVEESGKVDDPELFTRTYAAAALAAHALKQGDPTARLLECTKQSERLGLTEVCARCYGALAERPGDLDARARHARTASAFDAGEKASVYALYVVAVDAFNAGRNELAIELATLARPNAGTLAVALDEIISSARAQ